LIILDYKNTSTERNFIIEDKDKMLFTLMKKICDSDFPHPDDPLCLQLNEELYKRKRRYRFKELGDGTIYISFPRINPFMYIWLHIRFYLWDKYHDDEEEEYDDEETL